jgi:hypothetical protein
MLRHRLSISLVMDLSSPMNQVRRSTNSRRRRWFWVVQRPTSFGFSLYIRCRMYNWPWGLIARFRGRHEHTIHVAPEDPGVETTPPTPSTTWPQSIMSSACSRSARVMWHGTNPQLTRLLAGREELNKLLTDKALDYLVQVLCCAIPRVEFCRRRLGMGGGGCGRSVEDEHRSRHCFSPEPAQYGYILHRTPRHAHYRWVPVTPPPHFILEYTGQ